MREINVDIITQAICDMCINANKKLPVDLEELIVKMESEGLNPKKVKALIINYPNNPTGAIATRKFYNSLIEKALKYK